MFTPRSTPSLSPLLKVAPALAFSDTNLTILRQLTNDCGAPWTGEPVSLLLQLAERIVLHQLREIRQKGLWLLRSVLDDNRASPALFDILTATPSIVQTLAQGMLSAVQAYDAETSREHLLVLATLALETGRGPLLSPSILTTLLRGMRVELQFVLAALLRCVMHEDFGHLAATVMTAILEHPDTQAVAVKALVELLEAELDVPAALESRLWELLMEDDLMAQFVLFRLYSAGGRLFGKADSNVAGKRALLVGRKLRADVAKRGRFPHVYLDLIMLFVLLKEETAAAMAQSRTQTEDGWFLFTRPSLCSDLEVLTTGLLALLRGNLEQTRDAYQHDMLAAILTNVLIDHGTSFTPRIRDAIQQYARGTPTDHRNRMLMMAQTLPGSPKADLQELFASWLVLATQEGARSREAFSVSKSQLEPDPNSAAFYLPLIHAELYQLTRPHPKA